MFYKAVFVALTIFLIGSNGKPTISLNDQPERCCAPNKFSCQISTSTGMQLPYGKLYESFAYYNFSFDSDRAMVGMKGVSWTEPDQQKTNLWIIEDFNKRISYVINQDLKKCDKSPLPMEHDRCIPETATFVRSSTFGYGQKQLIGDTWRIQKDEFINYATVSRDGLCVPLAGQVFFQKPAMVSSMTTTDFVPQIDDPSIFDIPTECQSAV
ncbi:unnamed protein product [Rotaria sordida]|uniref:Uncharacterized protein n=2 Tax=Rotaria sordida TaxID=392033 RepID=A0A813W064_9BILA|nr:unnamed protein product [Rotaria sordida]CAF0850547.1 unnamed protein product [Rotaria sordida]